MVQHKSRQQGGVMRFEKEVSEAALNATISKTSTAAGVLEKPHRRVRELIKTLTALCSRRKMAWKICNNS